MALVQKLIPETSMRKSAGERPSATSFLKMQDGKNCGSVSQRIKTRRPRVPRVRIRGTIKFSGKDAIENRELWGCSILAIRTRIMMLGLILEIVAF